MDNLCSSQPCNRKAISRGFCDKHYRRFWKYGSPACCGTRKVAEGDEDQRFHQKYIVQDNGCWIWQAGTSPNNKGVLYSKFSKDNGVTTSGHRFAYAKYVGEIKRGAYICHKCDTPLCVNPEHLFQSDHAGNMRDMVEKGRSHTGRGQRANASVLTDAQAAEIRSLDLSQSKIAAIYGISQTGVSRIKRGITYS